MISNPGIITGWLIRTLIVLAVALVPAGTLLAQDGALPDLNTRDVVWFLLESLVAESPAGQERVVSKLVEMGSRAVPVLVASHSSHQDPLQVSAALAALGRLDPTGIDRYFLTQTAGGGDDPSRGEAYAGLAQHGTASAPADLIRQMPENHYSLKRSAELCLTRLLGRHDTRDVYAGIGAALKAIDQDTRARVICRLGDTDSPRAIRLCVSLLGEYGSLDHALVSAIAQMPGVIPAEEVVPHLRELLESEVPGVTRETITALGFFQDTAAVEILIGYLADAPESIRGNAHWALKKISGLEFPADTVRWTVWCTGERDWWESTGKALLAVLGSGDSDQILIALRALGRGRLFRDLIRPEVEPLLTHEDPEIRAGAEELMQRLGFARRANAQSVTSALAAQGFTPIPSAELEKRKAPRSAPPPAPESTSIVPFAGLAVLLLLLFRIFGPAAIARFRAPRKAAAR